MADNKIDTVLLFGSFNPIHNGHTAVAGYVLDNGLCDELWFIVSPQNPLKPASMLAPDDERYRMAEIAVDETLNGRNVSVNDVEFYLPKPSYTIDTLDFLTSEFPERSFSILAGTDLFTNIKNWKESGRIMSEFRFLIYPRDGYITDYKCDNIVYLNEAPRLEYSSTDVRNALMRGDENAKKMVSAGVYSYIIEHNLWRPDDSVVIEELSEQINMSPLKSGLYLERARLYYKNARYDKALNDFLKVMEIEPENIEAREYAKLIGDIFEFRYMDYYNP